VILSSVNGEAVVKPGRLDFIEQLGESDVVVFQGLVAFDGEIEANRAWGRFEPIACPEEQPVIPPDNRTRGDNPLE
jgi:hypothetical protein